MVGLSVCLLVTFVSPAKMAEPIEIPFGGLTRVGPWNHVLDGPQSPKGKGQFLEIVCPYKSIEPLQQCMQKQLKQSRCHLGTYLNEPNMGIKVGRIHLPLQGLNSRRFQHAIEPCKNDKTDRVADSCVKRTMYYNDGLFCMAAKGWINTRYNVVKRNRNNTNNVP